MTKDQLVAQVAEEADITKKQAADVVKAFTSVVSAALAKGDNVTIPGFGTFSVSQRAARTGRNPQTGEKIEIAARKVPIFKAGSTLKSAITILTGT
jgi:DNA-binding protein HU-beta